MKQSYRDNYNQILNMIGDYGKANSEVMSAFSKLHYVASKDGDLKSKYKELKALGISINSKCEGCIVMHINDAIKTGATQKEIIENHWNSNLYGRWSISCAWCKSLCCTKRI